ncbi:general secretion pathway protein GspK [Alginatibacterium sediminis]|uniref:Type II secretion system protein K n=1 Tax=Alginatibacterium sediminis TaxID=2164068 RepID=A0A420E5Q5_9ALTE|nr:type II secretion system minor pseudopilin GspK [Alginatibacterium sediminis]RKF13192.1 general secretion pathway protein GspK [Alginatibacterium sediminis]
MISAQRQRGAALVTVMLIVALMVIVASGFVQRTSTSIARVSLLKEDRKLYWYLEGAQQFVLKILAQDLSDNEQVSLGQYWATEGLVFPIEDIQVAGEVLDAQACFNLNALTTISGDETFEATDELSPTELLFKNILMSGDIDEYQASQLLQALQDWLDEDTVPRELGAEDGIYEAKTPPYLPANQALLEISELRAVEGYQQSIYHFLEHLSCALPITELVINVNTLKAEQSPILMALFYPSLSQDDAISLLDDRPREGYESIESFVELASAKGHSLAREDFNTLLGLSSQYFKLRLVAQSDNSQQEQSALIYMQDGQAQILRRQLGIQL